MRLNVKALFRKFHELPENLTSEHYRFFVFVNYAFLMAGIFHFAFIVVFVFIGIEILALYNVLSSLLYGTLIYLNLRGMRTLPLILGNIEVLFHAAFCVALLGWDSGFNYYILAVPLIAFLSTWPNYGKILLCALNGIAYVLLNYYSNIANPATIINPVYVNLFNYLNCLSIFFIISYLAYYYRFIVLRIESKLEMEHQRTTEILDRLNKDLSDAADYITTILPRPIQEGPVRSNWKFIPSESLGGDAFGYHWLDKDNFAIYLLDVSGHGVGAALLSATITNVLRSHALPHIDFCEPDQVLSALNRSFPGEENNDMFFTIWYGVYNKNTRYLAYASGGHPPALLFSDATNENPPFARLETPNYIVGGMKNAAYQKDALSLKSNSCLYVFSDGVYEFIQTDGSRWKYNEFANYLNRLHSGDETDIDRIVKSVENLSQSNAFEDDFTILKVSFL